MTLFPALFFLILFAIEFFSPLRDRKKHPFDKRLLTNAVLSFLVILVSFVAIRPACLTMVSWAGSHSWGLLFGLGLSKIATFILGFLLLDLSFYGWHRLNHEWSFLWRFHNVHHVDRQLDVSTSVRFHFIEVAFSLVFRLFQVLAIGVGLELFLFYEVVFQCATYFHHSNLRLPYFLEKTLAVFIVTPRMHTLHHSERKDQTHSNYGVIFSFWDKLFQTHRAFMNRSKVTIGVPGYPDIEQKGVLFLLRMPFIKQKEYWPR